MKLFAIAAFSFAAGVWITAKLVSTVIKDGKLDDAIDELRVRRQKQMMYE